MVKVRMEHAEEADTKRLLHVEVEADRVEEHMDRAFNNMQNEVVIPGFRKGKVPRKIFEHRFGTEVLRQEAIEQLVPEAYEEAIEQLEIDPIDSPDIQDLNDETEDGGVSFTAEVEIVPEVELGKYKELDVELEEPEITDEDVEEVIQNLRSNQATVELAEEGAELEPGMIGVVSFTGYLDGEPLEELTAEEEMIEIGSGDYLPDFEEGLIGAQAEQELSLDVQFPEDARPPLDGAEVKFEVDVLEVRTKTLPELDDELAKESGFEDVETVQELRELVRERLQLNRESMVISEFEQEVIDQVIANATVEVPEVMAQRAFDQQKERLQNEMDSYDVTMEQFVQQRGYGSVKEFEDEMWEAAHTNVEQMLVLEAVADAEDVQVTEEELDEKIGERAQMMGADVEMLRQYMLGSAQAGELESEVKIEKVRRQLATWADNEYDEMKERVENKQREFEEQQRLAQEQQLQQAQEEASLENDNDKPGEEE